MKRLSLVIFVVVLFIPCMALAQSEERVDAGTWPWISIVTGLVGVAIGYGLGLKGKMLHGGTPCGAACTCKGPAVCTLTHPHCTNRQCAGGCVGKCNAATGHAGAHTCTHGHTF